MCSTPFPAGMCYDSLPQPPDLSKDIAMEDWDLLFDAVIARLQSSCNDKPLDNGTPRRMEASFVCGPKSVPVRFRMT